MLKLDHGHATRAAGLIAAATLTLGGIALAAPTTKSSPPVRETREVKEVRVLGGQVPKDLTEMNCPGQKIEVSSKASAGKHKERESKVILCGDKGASGKQLAKMVDGTIARIQSDKEMDTAERADIVAQLRAKSAELRSR